ncbi:MAG: NRDE family protein [Novosphingobium sp.]|uniref:NRDE family protein n=1 Tax=Novosphingobium sp. TaxID=1874826 RepID=UPI0032B8EE1A
MCVAAIAWATDPRWRLVAIGNRDEFHGRPAAPLGPWADGRILAGRDLEAGGTWLGVGNGRFGLVTNLRTPGYPKPDLASRGALVTDWLRGNEPAPQPEMNPFNLWLADGAVLKVVTNHPHWEMLKLDPGIHGLSNSAHHDRWFKTRRLEAALRRWLESGAGTDLLFAALRDQTPETADPEDTFSSVFIQNPRYGTRCSSVVTVNAAGQGRIAERSFDAAGVQTSEVALEFSWTNQAA